MEPIAREAKKPRKFSNAWELARLDPLELDAKHVDHVNRSDDRIEIIDYLRAKALERARHQRWRPNKNDLRPELGQCPEIGTRHPAVNDVTDDRHSQSGNLPEPF